MSTKIDLDKAIRHFPWDRLYQDLGYVMHYPEVLMASERAYALHTQVSGLLMDLIYDGSLSYALIEAPLPDGSTQSVLQSISLQGESEVWAYIGIPTERLESYILDALETYLQHYYQQQGIQTQQVQ